MHPSETGQQFWCGVYGLSIDPAADVARLYEHWAAAAAGSNAHSVCVGGACWSLSAAVGHHRPIVIGRISLICTMCPLAGSVGIRCRYFGVEERCYVFILSRLAELLYHNICCL